MPRRNRETQAGARKRAAQRPAKPRAAKRWSQRVAESSNALDLAPGVFARDDPKSIARSLRRSAERSSRRKADPFRSAMSMLVYYVNRAGKSLGTRRRSILERAKDELRRAFGRPPRTR